MGNPPVDLCHSSLRALKRSLDEGGITADDILQACYRRIDAVEERVHAFVRVDRSPARTAASGGPLAGIPIALKDNICVRGAQTTCASRILRGFRAPYDATVVTKLKEAGAVLIGTTNMDEFAFGSSCETSCYGPTRNPWSLDAAPGGSSGGSAAAVAAGEVVAALGSDTGGSVRQPAAFCNVVGLKPTYGRVSRYGLIAFASSLDQIGPLTRTVEDAAVLLQVIAGYDPHDSTSIDLPVPAYTDALGRDLKGVRVGIPREYFPAGIDPEVNAALQEAIAQVRNMGAVCVPVSLPHTDYAVSVYYILAPAEASSNLARFDGVQYGLRAQADDLASLYHATREEGFGPEAKRRIILGTYVLSSGYYDAYYLKALKVRTRIKKDFDDAFTACDCLLTPTSPSPAFSLGERLADPLSMYLSDVFTIPANLAGVPAISVPCGCTRTGLPVGMQLIGRPFDEELLLRVAHAYERRTEWHLRRPPL